MGCANNNAFKYISTTEDIIISIKEENMRIEDNLITSGLVFKTDTKSLDKIQRIRNFLKLSEELIDMIKNKTVKNPSYFGDLLYNCYKNIFDDSLNKSSIYIKRTYKYITRYPPK